MQLTGPLYQHSVPGPRLQLLGASHAQVRALSSAFCGSPVRCADTVHPSHAMPLLCTSHTQVWVLSSALCSPPVRRTDTVCLGHAMQSLGTSHTLVRALSCAFCGSPVRRADTVCLGLSMRLCALVTPRRCATHLRLANTLCRHWVPWPRYAVAVCPSHTQVRTLVSAFCGLRQEVLTRCVVATHGVHYYGRPHLTGRWYRYCVFDCALIRVRRTTTRAVRRTWLRTRLWPCLVTDAF